MAGLVFLVGAVLTIIGLVRRSKSKRQQYSIRRVPLPGYGPGQQPYYPGPLRDPHDATPIHYTITSSVAGYILASIVVGVLGLVAALPYDFRT